MGWTYNNIRVYVQDYEEDAKQIIARLQPLAAGTVLQVFGHEDDVIKIQGKVVGNTNLDALKALIDDGAPYALADGGSYSRSLYLAGIVAKRDQFISQTIDTAQACDAPVYTVTMELYA